MENKSLWKKSTAVMVIAVMVLMAIPMMVLDAEAAPEEVEEYVFYIDLTPDCEQNGEWITGFGVDSADAFVDAINKAYGEESNVVSGSWITKINNIESEVVYGEVGHCNFSQYGYVDSEWKTDAYLGADVTSTNNHYAIFFTEHISTETGAYVDESGVADEAAVLAAAVYPAEGKVVPENYTAVVMTALDADEDNTWDVTWYIMPNNILGHESEYVDGGWGAAQRDDAKGLSIPDNDGGSNSLVLVSAIVVAVLAVAAIGAIIFVRRR